ncbi:MAG: hypothetical protein JWO38_2384 [Gemmataceae bacterium]|nr:hypothetical protein [Gemmataceae bacterium]
MNAYLFVPRLEEIEGRFTPTGMVPVAAPAAVAFAGFNAQPALLSNLGSAPSTGAQNQSPVVTNAVNQTGPATANPTSGGGFDHVVALNANLTDPAQTAVNNAPAGSAATGSTGTTSTGTTSTVQAPIIAGPATATIGPLLTGTSTLPTPTNLLSGQLLIGVSLPGLTAFFFGSLPIEFFAFSTSGGGTQPGPGDQFIPVGSGTGTGGPGIGTTPNVPPGTPPSTILQNGTSASGTNGTTG